MSVTGMQFAQDTPDQQMLMQWMHGRWRGALGGSPLPLGQPRHGLLGAAQGIAPPLPHSHPPFLCVSPIFKQTDLTFRLLSSAGCSLLTLPSGDTTLT